MFTGSLKRLGLLNSGVFLFATALTVPAFAAESTDSLAARIQMLEKTVKQQQEVLGQMKEQLNAEKKKTRDTAAKVASEDNRDLNFHFTGYAKADYTAFDNTVANDPFGAAQFSPIFLVDYKDILSFKAETEMSAQTDGSTKLELEYAQINWKATDWLTLIGGKFLSPIGDFQQHSHPAWINKLPDRPAGFKEDGGAEPLSEVGVQARGAFELGNMTAEYAVYVGNGPRLSDEEAAGAVKNEGFGGDDNDDKAYGGRIGIHPLPYVRLGVSGMHAKITGNRGAGGNIGNADYYVLGADAAFTKGPWDIRGEYLYSHLGAIMTAPDPTDNTTVIPDTRWQTWYVQAAYKLSDITDQKFLKNLEPVVRFSQLDTNGFSGFETIDEDRFSLGLNYWFAPSAVAKLAYENRNFRQMEDQDVFRAQLALGF